MPREAGMSDADRHERWKRVIILTSRGVPATEIAENLGISVTHVFRLRAQKWGAKPSPRRFTDAEIAQIEDMLSDGMSLAEIARTLGRHPASVSKRFRGRGWSQVQGAEHGALMAKVHHQLGL